MVPNSDYTPDVHVQKFLVDKFKLRQCGQVVSSIGIEIPGLLATESQIL